MNKPMSILACMLMLVPVGAQAASLEAGYAGGNGNDGVMFNLATTSKIQLQAFDINADFGTFDYRIYYRAGGVAGGVAGGIANPASWTLIGSFDALTTSGEGRATLLDFTDLTLNSGLHGFYITDGGAFSVRYSNSATPSGSTQAALAPVRLQVGYGVDAFGSVTSDRAFNGGVQFTAVPEPAAWVALATGFGIAGGAIRRGRRRRAAHHIA